MMRFLYNLPSAGMGVLVVGATVLITLSGYALARRLWPARLDAEQRAMALTMLSIVTTINSLLVAFAAIAVWDAYNEAERTVAQEAACAEELARDLDAFDAPQARAAAQALQTYLEQTVAREWPVMQQTLHPDPATEARFSRVFALSNRLSPATPRQTVLLGEVLQRVNEMVKLRQHRLHSLHAVMPATLWTVILVVSGLSFALLYVLPPTPFHIGLITAWSITLGLAFFFVLVVDRPFAGEFSVGAAPLQRTVERLIQDKVWSRTRTARPTDTEETST